MCRVYATVKGRRIILQTIGYRGKREARTEFSDLRQARAFIMYKADARALGIKVGSRVTVRVGRRRIVCRVRSWSRGSKLLLPSREYPLAGISRAEFERVHAPSRR